MSNEAPVSISPKQIEYLRLTCRELPRMHITPWVFGSGGPMYDANEGRATSGLILCDASKLYQEPYNDKLSPTSASGERTPSRNYKSRPPGPNREPLKGFINA